jgi:hypothetical protein
MVGRLHLHRGQRRQAQRQQAWQPPRLQPLPLLIPRHLLCLLAAATVQPFTVNVAGKDGPVRLVARRVYAFKEPAFLTASSTAAGLDAKLLGLPTWSSKASGKLPVVTKHPSKNTSTCTLLFDSRCP